MLAAFAFGIGIIIGALVMTAIIAPDIAKCREKRRRDDALRHFPASARVDDLVVIRCDHSEHEIRARKWSNGIWHTEHGEEIRAGIRDWRHLIDGVDP